MRCSVRIVASADATRSTRNPILPPTYTLGRLYARIDPPLGVDANMRHNVHNSTCHPLKHHPPAHHANSAQWYACIGSHIDIVTCDGMQHARMRTSTFRHFNKDPPPRPTPPTLQHRHSWVHILALSHVTLTCAYAHQQTQPTHRTSKPRAHAPNPHRKWWAGNPSHCWPCF